MHRVDWVHGLLCEEIRREPDTASWVFRFGSSVQLRVSAPWRVVSEGRNAVAGVDHGHLFGLKQPVDTVARAMELLRGRPITELSADLRSGDVRVDFGEGRLLEVFNESSGYEGWTLSEETSRRLLVGLGGGGIAIWDQPDLSPR